MQCHSIISFKWNFISKKIPSWLVVQSTAETKWGYRKRGQPIISIPILNRSEAPQGVYPSKLFIYVKKSNQDLESREARFELLI
jgi:hypothetical protein